MNLSKNFTLAELTVTNQQLPNMPGANEIQNLTVLCSKILQPLRDQLGKPIKINSGYRSTAVNKAIGGAPTSQHCTGEAADLDYGDNAMLFNLIRSHFDFDQLIWEGGDDKQPAWVHVSYKAKANRKQVLRMKVVDGNKKYVTI